MGIYSEENKKMLPAIYLKLEIVGDKISEYIRKFKQER